MTATAPPARATRLAVAIATFASTVALSYALIRVAQKLYFPEPDPAIVIWSARAAMFWRFWIGLYIGGMAGLGAYAATATSAAAAARWLVRGVLLAAIAIAAQGLLLP